MTMKKLQLISLLLLYLMLFTSCAGIGDGALVAGGGISPTIQTEPVDTKAVVENTAKAETATKETLTRPSTVALLDEVGHCEISLIVNGEVQNMVSFDNGEAAEIYRIFSASKIEPTGSMGVNERHCIKVKFTDTNGGYEFFTVSSNNIFYKNYFSTMSSSGKIDGVYDKLKGYLE
jgi:hypothetical protein